jgi:Holliday junction resolvase RusA-like endonuclease
MGAIHVARFYDSDVADAWKRQVMLAIVEAVNISRWQITKEPVAVAMRFPMPRPKSHFGAKGIRPKAPLYHIGKPDVDNLAKLVLDQITKTARVWLDDSQVVDLRCYKFWDDDNEKQVYVAISDVHIPR